MVMVQRNINKEVLIISLISLNNTAEINHKESKHQSLIIINEIKKVEDMDKLHSIKISQSRADKLLCFFRNNNKENFHLYKNSNNNKKYVSCQ